MKLDDIQPSHCFVLARRILAELERVRDEMGRAPDTRPVPEISGAEPREVYFEACVAWRKAARLASEVGADGAGGVPPGAPALQRVRPGHVHRMLEAVLAQVTGVKQRLSIVEKVTDEAVDAARKPSDVLATLMRVNRELSRCLERPFAPSDVFTTVAQAAAYVERLGATAPAASFERGKKPAQCYEVLGACLVRAAALIEKRGHKALVARGTPPDVLPGDVYDLANLVLGEVAFLHAITEGAEPLHAFEPEAAGHRLPAHVHQLARTLEAQLAAVS